jgi:hypothetical protein
MWFNLDETEYEKAEDGSWVDDAGPRWEATFDECAATHTLLIALGYLHDCPNFLVFPEAVSPPTGGFFLFESLG